MESEAGVEQAHLELARRREQQARRAQVPVRHPWLALVHVVERLRELQRPPHRLPPGRRPPPRTSSATARGSGAAGGEGTGKSAAGGGLADEEDVAGGVVEAGAEKADDAGVAEAGEGADFDEEEALDSIFVGYGS